MDKPQIIAHVEKSVNFTLFDTKWLPLSSKFAVVGSTTRDTGCIQIYDISAKDINLLKECEKPKSIKCCTFGSSKIPDYHLATGNFDGRLAIWDLDKGVDLTNPIYGVQAHNEIINCIDAIGGSSLSCGAPEIVTGSRDGTVKVWDPRQPKTAVLSMEPEERNDDGDKNSTSGKRDCWTVGFGNAFNSTERCVAAGYDNGDLKLFDLRFTKVRWETNLKNGICGLEFDRKDIAMNKLVATTLEGKFHVFDLRTMHPTKGYASLSEMAHKSTIWQAKHLPQQRDIFMTLGGNGTLNLWKYNYPDKRKRKCKADIDGKEKECEEGVIGSVSQLQNITVASQPISSFDWCPEKMGLAVSVSFDQIIRLLVITRLHSI